MRECESVCVGRREEGGVREYESVCVGRRKEGGGRSESSTCIKCTYHSIPSKRPWVLSLIIHATQTCERLPRMEIR